MTPRANVVALTAPVEAAGAVIWWHLSGCVSLHSLSQAWKDRGWSPDDLPEVPSPKTALRRALRAQESKTRFVRQVEGGWALVEQRQVPDSSDPAFVILLLAGLGEDDRPAFARGDETGPELEAAVGAAFDLARIELEPADVSSWMVWYGLKLSAVPLRDTGGLYFIPAQTLAQWHELATVVREVSRHTLCEIPAMRSDEAVSAILDAVQREAQAEAEAMEAELAKGIGERAINTRLERTEAVEKKISLYEDLLGSKLETLRSRLSVLRSNLSLALLSSESAE